MTDRQEPAAGPSHLERNSSLRVAPTPDIPHPSGLQTPTRIIKIPFGGDQTIGEPPVKHVRKDPNRDGSRSQERKPRTLGAAMMSEQFDMSNWKTLDEIRARMATAILSNNTGQYNNPRSLRRTEPVNPEMTAQPTAPKSLGDAPPLLLDTPPIPRQNPLGSKKNPVVFGSGLEELDRDFRGGSGYDRRRYAPCSVAGGVMDDDSLLSSSLGDHRRHERTFDSGRDGLLPTSQSQHHRSSWSKEKLHGKKMRDKRQHEDDEHGRTRPRGRSLHGSDNEADPVRLSRARSRKLEMRYRDRTNNCVVRPKSRSRSLSRECNDDRYRGSNAFKLQPQPPHGHWRRQDRTESPRERFKGRLSRSKSTERSQTPEQHRILTQAQLRFEFADPPPDPLEGLGVDPSAYTEEQQLALFQLLIARYANRKKVSELTYNMMRLQYERDNKRAALGRRHVRKQRDDF